MSSTRPGGAGRFDLYLFRREGPGLPFAEPTPLASVNTGANEWDPFLTPDGLTLLWAGTADDGGELLRATRGTVDSQFGHPEPVLDLLGSAEGNPSMTQDGRTLVFNSAALGNMDVLYVMRDAPGEAWSAPRRVPDINGDAREGEPFVSGDGCELFWVVAGDYYRATYLGAAL